MAAPQPTRRGRWPACGCSSWRASGPGRSVPCCSPTRARPCCASTGPVRPPPTRARVPEPRPPVRRARPEAPARGGRAAPAGRHRGRTARRAAPGGDRAPRRGPRRLPAPQPAAGLRPDDGLGPGRPAGLDGRSRHRLHRPHRRPARTGPGRRPAAVPGEPARRLRRRRDADGLRDLRGPGRAGHLRAGARWWTRPSWTGWPRCWPCR
jgi:hypothetical protein